MTKKKAIEYFNQTQKDIELLWGSNRNYSIHYGYHDKDHKTHDKALVNMNRIIAKTAKIKPNSKILDAGCGIGGSAIWLAKNYSTKVVGININNMQIEKAKKLSAKNNVQDLTEFHARDFTDTKQKSNTFDTVWAIESAIFAEKKHSFLKESKRILKPGGRIIIADIFKKEDITKKEQHMIDRWLNGWASPNIVSAKEFEKDLKHAGFKNIELKNITKNIIPSSRRMYLGSIFIYPLYKLLQLAGKRTQTQTKTIASAYHQYRALKKGLWEYIIISAHK